VLYPHLCGLVEAEGRWMTGASPRTRLCFHLVGPWCSWHADWAVAECLDKVGVQPVGHPRFGQYTCDKRSLSCHNVGPRQQRSLWNRHLRDWFPCDSPYAGPEEDARRARVSRCAPPHGGKLSDPMGVKDYNYSADGLTKEGYMAL